MVIIASFFFSGILFDRPNNRIFPVCVECMFVTFQRKYLIIALLCFCFQMGFYHVPDIYFVLITLRIRPVLTR